MKAIKLKDVKKGDFVRRSLLAKKTYKRSEYDRSEKKYWLKDCGDISSGLYLKGSTIVYIDFEY